MIGIPLGLLYSNAGEWLFHRYVLHGLGKNRKSFWSFHWHEHHAKARKNEMFDDQYTGNFLKWDPQTKELAALVGGAVLMAPLFPVAPFFTATVWWSMQNYYRKHKHSHLDAEWAKNELGWHYDHHMGRDQNANWCVTNPFFDHVMGTRKAYAYGQGAPKDAAVPLSEAPRWRKLVALKRALTERLPVREEAKVAVVVPVEQQAA